MKLRYISMVRARYGADIRAVVEGIAIAPGPGGKKAVFDFDWRQDRPQDFIRLLPRDVHSIRVGEFLVYYGFGFVPEGDSQGVQQVARQRQQVQQQKAVAPRQAGVQALMRLPDQILARFGYEPDDTDRLEGIGAIIRAHNTEVRQLLKSKLGGWATANPDDAVRLQVGVPTTAGMSTRPTTPAEYYTDALSRVEQVFSTTDTYQVLGSKGKELTQRQTQAAVAYRKASNILANMIQDQGAANPDVDRLLDVAAENLVEKTGGEYKSIIIPQSSNPTALLIAKRIANYTGVTVGQPFRKPTESGPRGLHFDEAAYYHDTGKTVDQNTNMGGRYQLPLAKVLSNPSKFKMTSISKTMRPYWRNTQTVDERWLAANCAGKVLVVDDSIMSGSTMMELMQQVGSYADIVEGYALLKIGT